jgi:hypothetical protein
MNIFPISVEKILVSLKSDKKNGYFTRRPIFLERYMFQTTVAEEIKTYILCSVNFFPENCAIYEIMWKNTAQPDRLQTAIQNGACAMYVG